MMDSLASMKPRSVVVWLERWTLTVPPEAQRQLRPAFRSTSAIAALVVLQTSAPWISARQNGGRLGIHVARYLHTNYTITVVSLARGSAVRIAAPSLSVDRLCQRPTSVRSCYVSFRPEASLCFFRAHSQSIDNDVAVRRGLASKIVASRSRSGLVCGRTALLGVHVVRSDDAGKDEFDKRILEDAGSHSPSLSSSTVPRSEPKEGSPLRCGPRWMDPGDLPSLSVASSFLNLPLERKTLCFKMKDRPFQDRVSPPWQGWTSARRRLVSARASVLLGRGSF
ncbi:hypothetical protein L1887_56586 [Cichorium endivia]|nr:hypothetical protein L1887_56586 [Cichorium endivia]